MLSLSFNAILFLNGGTAAAVPPPFRPGDPALCRSRPLVTPYYCRLGDLLCLFVYIILCVHYCLCICVFSCFRFFLCLLLHFLQYFDTVGWVFLPVKTVSRITYTVLVGT